jgi:hypothetical protein
VAFAPQLIDCAAIAGVDQPTAGVRDLGATRPGPRVLRQPLSDQIVLASLDPRLGEIQTAQLAV